MVMLPIIDAEEKQSNISIVACGTRVDLKPSTFRQIIRTLEKASNARTIRKNLSSQERTVLMGSMGLSVVDERTKKVKKNGRKSRRRSTSPKDGFKKV